MYVYGMVQIFRLNAWQSPGKLLGYADEPRDKKECVTEKASKNHG